MLSQRILNAWTSYYKQNAVLCFQLRCRLGTIDPTRWVQFSIIVICQPIRLISGSKTKHIHHTSYYTTNLHNFSRKTIFQWLLSPIRLITSYSGQPFLVVVHCACSCLHAISFPFFLYAIWLFYLYHNFLLCFILSRCLTMSFSIFPCCFSLFCQQ